MIQRAWDIFGNLLLLGGIAHNIGIDQLLELLGTKSRNELERSTQKGLRDCEGGEIVSGGHCD
jgi:hypothetical protein